MHLGDLIRPSSVRRAGNTVLPILSITMHSGLVDQSGKFKKRVASIDTSPYRVVTRGQLVVGFPIDEGVLSFQQLYDEAIVSPAYDIWDLIDERSVDIRYLERFLRSPRALRFYASKLRGTTERRRTLPDDIFLSLVVPVPPLSEQRRIADILDRVDALRFKSRAATSRLDTLMQAIFLEMFGHPEENPKGWPVENLGQVTDFCAGGSLPAGIPFVDQQAGYLLLKVSDLNRIGNEKYIRGSKEWSAAPGSKGATCPAKSVIIPKRGGAIGTNKKRITTRPSVLDPNLMAITPMVGGLAVQYLFGWFLQLDLTTLTSGSSVPQLNKRDLAPLRIPVPPIKLQIELAQRVSRIETIEASLRARQDNFDALFRSLQYRAFRGEL
jgi:type I restriction enzyme S subunit